MILIKVMLIVVMALSMMMVMLVMTIRMMMMMRIRLAAMMVVMMVVIMVMMVAMILMIMMPATIWWTPGEPTEAIWELKKPPAVQPLLDRTSVFGAKRDS